MPGMSIFQWLERLLSLLALDTFLFGTAIFVSLFLLIFFLRILVQKGLQDREFRVDVFVLPAPAVAVLQPLPAFRAEAGTVGFAQIEGGDGEGRFLDQVGVGDQFPLVHHQHVVGHAVPLSVVVEVRDLGGGFGEDHALYVEGDFPADVVEAARASGHVGDRDVRPEPEAPEGVDRFSGDMDPILGNHHVVGEFDAFRVRVGGIEGVIEANGVRTLFQKVGQVQLHPVLRAKSFARGMFSANPQVRGNATLFHKNPR